MDKAAGKAVDNAWEAVFGADSATYNGSSVDTAKHRQLSAVLIRLTYPLKISIVLKLKRPWK